MKYLISGYRSCKLPKLPISKPQQTSIGKLLQTTNKSCPRRNNVLGKHFCRFAVRLKQYTEATSNSLIVDTNHLQNQFDELISKLDLNDPFEKDSNPIRLPSTGQLLSTSINKSLDKWKCNAYDEVKVNFINSQIRFEWKLMPKRRKKNKTNFKKKNKLFEIFRKFTALQTIQRMN